MAKEKKVKLAKQKKEKALTDVDLMKIEIASELGLLDKVSRTGWKSLTARESGKIGGLLAKRMRDKAEKASNETEKRFDDN